MENPNIDIQSDAPVFTLIICAVGLAALGAGVLTMSIPLIINKGGMWKVAGVCCSVWAPGCFYMSYIYMKKIRKKLKR